MVLFLVAKEEVDLRYSKRFPWENRHFLRTSLGDSIPDCARQPFRPLWDAKPVGRVPVKA